MDIVDMAGKELRSVLEDARQLIARPGNNYGWSGWDNAEQALSELDKFIAAIDSGQLPDRLAVSILFAPTGPLQEVSISSGWGDEFLALASRCDAALEKVYGLA